MTGLVTATDRFARFLAHIGGAALVAMMLVLVANIVLRTFTAPIPSTFEVVSMAAVVVSAMALGEAQVHKAHVSVDIVTSRLGRRLRLVIGAVVTIASFALFVQLGLSLLGYGLTEYETGSATEALRVPHWPLVFLLLAGVVGLLVAFLGDLGRIIRSWRWPSSEADLW
ncbi:TRAP-type C4-dicarboxylate transport system permease small subunit [Lipingzhangella halophila]|uniref:TRAP-type C4-dicarboxylate transport system permease small subunit n=1 Tax=Lipingzhangella halophila TaxID=1783352 RepID=A0A7W7RFX8_9ACTN|nr:TRAP transporter small permease subunit [Lipingzhangella halophila]MBB4931145.1 TRAP-type C4-dicarboxylate transport system permease small subunit [Lipingzhangella halophila]